MDTSNGAPFQGYTFEFNGKYDPNAVKTFTDAASASEWTTQQLGLIQRGIEVMVTDSDDFIVFHAKDRKIIFPVEAAQLTVDIPLDRIE